MSDKLRVVTVSSYRDLCSACENPTFESLIDEATELLAMGYTRAAGAQTRQAIERTLLDLHDKAPAEPSQSSGNEVRLFKIRDEIARLVAKGSIQQEIRGSLEVTIGTCNRACHCEPVTASQVSFAIEIARFLRRKVEKAICNVRARAMKEAAKAVPLGPTTVVESYLLPFQVFAA